MRCIIVDDDPDICEMFRMICRKEDVVSVTAYNLREARKAVDCLPKIAFIDYQLPDGLGITLVRSLKEKYTDLYVVLMNALPNLQVLNEAFSNGADSFLPKPFDIEAVDRLIADHR